jgi:hypothetical protein
MRFFLCRLVLLGLVFAVGAGLAGCSSERPTYPVEGKVVYPDGTPLDDCQIEFDLITSEPKERINARGMTAPDGTFQLSTFRKDDGAVAGEHRVIVIPPGVDNADRFKGKALPPPAIDPRFSRYDQSGLQFTVKPEKNLIVIQVEKPAKKK